MARWGRRGLLYWLNQSGSWRRTKTVQWGSRPAGGSLPSLWSGLLSARPKRMRLGPHRGLFRAVPARPAKARPSFRKSGMKLGNRSRPLFAGGVVRSPQAGSGTGEAFRRAGGSAAKRGGSGGSGWGTRVSRPRKRRGTLWLIAGMVVILAAIQSFIYVDRHLRIPMMNVAKVRMNQVATQAINQAITEQVASQASFDKLIDWKTSGEGKISGFMLNYSEHMKITAETIDTVSRTLYDLQHLKESIPIGHALGSAILSSYGPRVPVQFEPVGATQVQLNTRQSSIGINNTLVEVYIKVVTEISIIIPFDTEPQKVEAEIPVSYLLVVGDVPMYYYDNKGNPVGDSAGSAPNISVPLGGEEGPQGTKRQEESGNVPGAGGQEESGGAGIITPPAGEQPGTSVPDGTQQEAGDGSGGSNGR